MMKRYLQIILICIGFCVHAEECVDCATVELLPNSEETSVRTVYDWSQGEAETNRIDLLMVYDASAVAWIDKQGQSVEEFTSTEVERLNVGLSNTGLDRHFTFRLAGIHVIAADFSTKQIGTTFNHFAGFSKPSNDAERAATEEARTVRNRVAADIVVVLCDLADKSGGYGIAHGFTKDSLSTSGLAQMAEKAYCVCDISSLATRFTLMHELGHIFGAGHDTEQRNSPGPQLKSYSAGYQFSYGGENHTSVMGIIVSHGKRFTRWPFFSSPLYVFGENGPAVGTVKYHDNSRTLRETYPIVANFRVATLLPPPPALAISIERLMNSEEARIVSDMETIRTMRYVNEDFRISVVSPSDSVKTSVSVKGLPSGLKYNSKTGLITGYPKKCGTSVVKVVASGKNLKSAQLQFTVEVSPLPTSLVGTYVGLMRIDDEISLMTLTLGGTGKVTLKGKVAGRTRTFAVSSLSHVEYESSENLVVTVRPSGKIGKTKRTFEFRISNRKAVCSDAATCVFHQKPWGRKDCVAPKFKKSFDVDVDGWRCKIRSNGRAYVTGSPTGTKFSGTFQLVPVVEDSFCGEEVEYAVPVVFSSKRIRGKTYDGFSGVLHILLTTNSKGCVTQANPMYMMDSSK